MKHYTLASFSTERRTAAIAFFLGMQLEDTELRHLPDDPSKASGSVRQLVTLSLEQHQPQFFSICRPVEKAGPRIRQLCDVVRKVATAKGIPVVEVGEEDLMEAYGHPPLKRKEHIRNVGRMIWPSLDNATSGRAAIDAAIVGLFVQVKRLFSFHEEAG